MNESVESKDSSIFKEGIELSRIVTLFSCLDFPRITRARDEL